MNPKKEIGITVALLLLLILPALVAWRWSASRHNPYEAQGLRFEWSYGAAGSVPTVRVWAEDSSGRIDAPIEFHGLVDPNLQFKDYDDNGTLDIIFQSGERMQALSFAPRKGVTPPNFAVLRNDVKGD